MLNWITPGSRRNKELKVFLQINENEGTTDTNIWEKKKAEQRGKYIALGTDIKKVEKSHTSDLPAHLKGLEQQKKQIHPGVDNRK